jgi:hypothetical protein
MLRGTCGWLTGIRQGLLKVAPANLVATGRACYLKSHLTSIEAIPASCNAYRSDTR